MGSTFWTNTIWYILLSITTIIVFIIAMVKSNNRKRIFAFFLAILGIILNFEAAILFLFKSYTYYPMIIKSSPRPFNDIIVGNVFSQLSVSASILLVVVLNLKYYWYFIIAAIYGCIEELFLYLGIYRHNWYRTWMTVVLLLLAFWIAKKMYRKIILGMKPVLYYGYIYLATFSIYVPIVLEIVP